MIGRASRLAVLGLVVVAVVPATAGAKARMYNVSPVRDIIDRSAVTVSGAAIVEVDHAEVIVTATPREVRKLRRQGYTVKRMYPLKRLAKRQRGGLARAADFPGADAAYHNYAEMSNEIAEPSRTRTRASSSASASGPSYEGRDAVGGEDLRQRRDRRERAGGAVHRRPARARAPHGRDGAVPAETS